MVRLKYLGLERLVVDWANKRSRRDPELVAVEQVLWVVAAHVERIVGVFRL